MNHQKFAERNNQAAMIKQESVQTIDQNELEGLFYDRIYFLMQFMMQFADE